MRTAPLVVALCLALGAGATLVVWLATERGPTHAALAPVALVVGESGARAVAHTGCDPSNEGEKATLEHVEPLAVHAARRPGILPPPPDTLVAVRGRVLEAASEKPVAGVTLSFLSRRPKTISVETDEEGWFATGPELASGVVAVLHAVQPEEPRFSARWDLDPAQFVVPPQSIGAPVREITLRATSPLHVLEFEVLTPEGLPAAGASVSLACGEHDRSGAFVALARDFEVADARGRVSYGLSGERALEHSYCIEAEHRGTLATDVLALDPPFALRVRTLELAPGGVVHVRLQNDEGRPIAGVSVRASAHEGGRFASGHVETSDARGECVFTPLRAACWTLDVIHPLTGRSVQRQVDLPRGGHARIDVPLSLSGLRLGVSGAVVDEHGYPLAGVQVALESSGHEPVILESGEGGRFEFWGRGEGPLTLGVGGGFLDDRFEPPLISVPFGTSGLLVRRVETLEPRTAALVLVDAATRAPVRRASVVLFHADARTHNVAQGLVRASADCGVAQIQFKPYEDASYCVDAPGYRRAEGRLMALAEAAGVLGPLTIELERGFERRVEVRDRATKRLISGAKFATAAGPLAQSGADGRAHLRAADWPPPLRVEAHGYEPLVWDPATAPYPGTLVWLEPLRADAR